jgi:glucose 1-dehydrogenase
MTADDERVVIVTGGGSWIGRATALRFARSRARVVIADVNGDAAEESAALVLAEGAEAIALPIDVSIRAHVERLVGEAVKRFGQVDVMVSNAGIGRSAPFLEISEDDLERVLAVNLKGVFWCGQVAARAMVDGGRGGCIVNTASTYAEVTAPGSSAYSASKGGVRMLTKSMALELGQYGIRVVAVAPGWIRTGMNPLADPERNRELEASIPLGRIASGEDVAGAIFALASHDARYISGDMVFVVGGWIVQ